MYRLFIRQVMIDYLKIDVEYIQLRSFTCEAIRIGNTLEGAFQNPVNYRGFCLLFWNLAPTSSSWILPVVLALQHAWSVRLEEHQTENNLLLRNGLYQRQHTIFMRYISR